MKIPEKRKFSLMVAVSQNGVIALKSGELPFNIPEDKEYYLDVIKDHVWIQARKSFENGPSSLLKTKHNIILSSKKDFDPKVDNSSVVASFEEALNLAAQMTSDGEKIFIGGGMGIYSEALSFADRIYLTRVHKDYLDGGAFFPAFDLSLWERSKSERKKSSQGLEFSYEVYNRKE